jgi:pyridoxamine 5'-phosphate oxidase
VNIADLRQEYMRAGLSEADAHADPFVQFERWFKEALAASLPLANAMTLATVTPEGGPDARVVLLKGVDGGGFVFYTNYESRKGRQLAARPEACLVFLWAPLERQIRIEGKIEKVTTAESDAYFVSRPLGARQSACASNQSAVVPGRAFLENKVKGIGSNPARPSYWGGYRLKPARIEFWQGRENRLHDRLLYKAGKGAWKIERLAP